MKHKKHAFSIKIAYFNIFLTLKYNIIILYYRYNNILYDLINCWNEFIDTQYI